MSNDVSVDLRQFQSGMIQGVKAGYDAVAQSGKLSNVSAMVMVGYLSSAANAFELVGDDYHAALFEKTASRIKNNWKEFMDAIQILFQTMSIEPESEA